MFYLYWFMPDLLCFISKHSVGKHLLIVLGSNLIYIFYYLFKVLQYFATFFKFTLFCLTYEVLYA